MLFFCADFLRFFADKVVSLRHICHTAGHRPLGKAFLVLWGTFVTWLAPEAPEL